jgi:hypothetical protein
MWHTYVDVAWAILVGSIPFDAAVIVALVLSKQEASDA